MRWRQENLRVCFVCRLSTMHARGRLPWSAEPCRNHLEIGLMRVKFKVRIEPAIRNQMKLD